ncbi:cation:proton antiporter [uncultured Alistipes sp.]|uniref:cation:proton antiporter n=1 Tax=uncultured Alistipes sp. TaxID=538949 RepID=UPI00261FB7EC|nr:cation:proton antiporter [uncultured Alistipes sp.]
MFPLLAHTAIELPLEDPILKFMLIMAIVLAAPLLLNKLKVPYLLGLIIAGAVIGPHGLNLVLRDSSIILSGTAGLLYIMFLSGLEMDTADFRRTGWHSLVFGLYTFSIPMLVGIPVGYFVLGFPIHSSVLLAGLFASQTLVAYPIVSKLGITRDKAVTLAVGGTIITDMLALLVLTIVVGTATGSADTAFWYRLGISVVLCVAVILLLFPLIGHWFFRRCTDSVSQYVFVLVMVFLGAFLAQLAGLEPIIGAFLAGLAMNPLIPRTSALMNRIEFVGNAVFIPFFLIGVGMLIDYRAFFKDWQTIEVSAAMIVGITLAKYLAAVLTQKTFRLTRDQRTLLFGLSSAHVAATLAAVMVGYNVILGHTPDGEPIRLLNESVLNGTILMILATCAVSTFATQRGAHNIAAGRTHNDEKPAASEHVLIPLSNTASVNELIGLSIGATSLRNRSLYALNAVDNRTDDPEVQKRARGILDMAASTAAAADVHMHRLLRYDVNIVNAITSVVRERNITDIVMGMHREKAVSALAAAFPSVLGQPVGPSLGKTLAAVLAQSNVTTLVYRPLQPLATIKRHVVFVPRRAEKEAGFHLWLDRVRNIIRNTGGKLVFYAPAATLEALSKGRKARQITDVEYNAFEAGWEEMPRILCTLKRNDCLWFVMSRRDRLSYQAAMGRIPGFLDDYADDNSCVLIYPVQAGDTEKRFMA